MWYCNGRFFFAHQSFCCCRTLFGHLFSLFSVHCVLFGDPKFGLIIIMKTWHQRPSTSIIFYTADERNKLKFFCHFLPYFSIYSGAYWIASYNNIPLLSFFIKLCSTHQNIFLLISFSGKNQIKKAHTTFLHQPTFQLANWVFPPFFLFRDVFFSHFL